MWDHPAGAPPGGWSDDAGAPAPSGGSWDDPEPPWGQSEPRRIGWADERDPPGPTAPDDDEWDDQAGDAWGPQVEGWPDTQSGGDRRRGSDW